MVHGGGFAVVWIVGNRGIGVGLRRRYFVVLILAMRSTISVELQIARLVRHAEAATEIDTIWKHLTGFR